MEKRYKKMEIKEIKKFCPFIKDICKGKECMMYKTRRVKFVGDDEYSLLGYCGNDISDDLADIRRAIEFSCPTPTDVSGIVHMLDDLTKQLVNIFKNR